MAETEPRRQYERNAEIYDSIADSVTETREAFLDAGRPLQRMVLNQAVTFAVISVQTPVHIHERGYLRLLNSSDTRQDAIAGALRDAGVNYCDNKARYIFHNMVNADKDRVIDHIEAEEYDKALRATKEEFLGVGLPKAGYSLAKLGVPKMACIDTHVAQMAGIEEQDRYTGTLPERYFDQWHTIEDSFPELREQMPGRFMFQWVLFDANRDGVTTHDAWFMSLPEQMNVSVP